MAEEILELRCRDVGVECDHVSRGKTELEVVEACAEHAAQVHGMHSFPPRLWVQMHRNVRVVRLP